MEAQDLLCYTVPMEQEKLLSFSMLVSSLKLKGTNCEVIVIVGADSIKDPTCGTSASNELLWETRL